MEDRRARSGRRAATVSAVPLGTFALSALLPTYRACSETHTAWHAITGPYPWAGPAYALAALLAVATLCMLLRSRLGRHPGPRALERLRASGPMPVARREPGLLAALPVGLALAAGAPFAMGAALVSGGRSAGTVAVAVAAVLLPSALVVVALTSTGWRRWTRLLFSWCFVTAWPVGAILTTQAVVARTSGAIVAVASLAAVLVASGLGGFWPIRASRRDRRTRAISTRPRDARRGPRSSSARDRSPRRRS